MMQPGTSPCESPPEISVIVACYNAQATVSQTLDSLLNQNDVDWEAICVDDGSTDETGALLDQYAARDRRFYVIKSAHVGQPAAKNLGIRAARAPRVMILDADDLARPDALRTLVAFSRAHADEALVCPGYELMTQNAEPLGVYRFAPTTVLTVDRLLHGNFLPSMTLVPKALLAERAFDEALPTGIDWDMWLYLAARRVHCVGVPRALIGYRLCHNSLSHNADRMFASGHEIIRCWQPHTKHSNAAPHAIHRLAVQYGAIALAARDNQALSRFWNRLPPLEVTPAFSAAAAQTIYGGFEFAHGAHGACWRDCCSTWLPEIVTWLETGPLAAHAADIAQGIHGRIVDTDPLPRITETLARRLNTKRLVIYGLGANGAALLARIEGDPALAKLELRAADDYASGHTFAALNLQQDDPQSWSTWPPHTTVVVTPQSHAAMEATLRAAGGRKNRDYFVLAQPSTTRPRRLELSIS